MFLLGSALRFILESIARAADAEGNDAPRLREQLMEAQLRFEAGAMSADELAALETSLLARLRALDVHGERRPIGLARVEIDLCDVPAPPLPTKRGRRGRRGAT